MLPKPQPQIDPEVLRLQRRLDREKRAREQAESLLEKKSDELYGALEMLGKQTQHSRALALAIDTINEGIAMTDATGNFRYMNDAHAAMFGYGKSELLGKHWTLLYGADARKQIEEVAFANLREKGHWRGETLGRSKNGDEVVQDIALTLQSNGGLICSTRDITLRKQREMEVREMEARLMSAEREAALFTIGNAVAHDFNNLIAAISGYAILIQEDLEHDETNQSRAARILSAAEQASGVIRSLEIARTNDIHSSDEVDLAATVQTSIAIANAIRPPSITFESDIPKTALITTNEVLLSRALLNISKNAFEAMGEQGRIFFRVAETASQSLSGGVLHRIGAIVDDPLWIIEITDEGPGIPASKIEGIFQSFVTSKAVNRGSGLGLDSLKTLTDASTASIEVESEVGVGTRFRIVFPKPVERATALHQQVDLRFENRSIRPRILIVDDDQMIGDMLVETLEKRGFEADWISNSEEALSVIESTALCIDLLLTDLTMPVIKGDELARRTKAFHPNLPIILYSGQAGYLPSDSIFSAVLTKPIDPDSLEREINMAIERQGFRSILGL